jgi:hypothetical protein
VAECRLRLPEQKQEFETYIASDWADAGKRKSTLQLLELMNKLVALPDDRRRHWYTRSFGRD